MPALLARRDGVTVGQRRQTGLGRGAPRYPRTQRLNEVLREILAEEIERLEEDPGQLLTVTGVSVDPDLRHATVWMASLSEDDAARLEHSRTALQAAVARQTRIKRTPRLSFHLDPAVVAGAAVEDALRRVHEAEAEAAEGGPPGTREPTS